MINRINLILRAKNITAKQFAEEIGIQPSGMSHIMSGRNNPSLEFVSKVIRRYPEIDANWLLLGKGEMYMGVKNDESRMKKEEMGNEPTLFTEPTPTPVYPPLSAPASEHVPEPSGEEVIDEPWENEENEPAPNKNDGRRLVKILFFYDDRTFEEYRPSVVV